MREDRYFSAVYLCPATMQIVTWGQHAYSYGVCPHCGHVRRSTFTHGRRVSGKWVRPSIREWLAGKRKWFRTHNDKEVAMGDDEE